VNTQTHLLLALAAFSRRPRDALAPASSPTVELALLLGALLPDASLFVMWGQAKLAGIPEARIWGELYYSDFWQASAAVTNSLPVFAALALLAWVGGGRLLGERTTRLSSMLLAIAAGALLHVVTDLPLHHDDGHPHFWPVSDWIFSSPVSYWDPAHYGRAWSILEIALAAALLLILWRRFRSLRVRVPLTLAALSYAVVAAYWTGQFGG